jgi:hypothetical protein
MNPDEARAHRAAQRRLARQIKSGTYEPSGAGAKARRVATERIKTLRDLAYYNINRRLSSYVKYKDDTVHANVYGGTTSESGLVPGMDYSQAEWTSKADTEELRSRAESKYRGNPWYYH